MTRDMAEHRHARGRSRFAILGGATTSIALIVLSGLSCAPTPPPATSPEARQTSPGPADAFLVVDCLLPGQIRRLGNQITFVGPRRAEKTTARDCEIRGGEYVAYDRADYKTALKVWMEAAQQGDPKAQTYVGEIYEKGLGVPADFAAAAQWYRRAAEQGYAPAALNLGALYENGLGVPRDPKEAAQWYRRAAEPGTLAFDVGQGAGRSDVRQIEAQLDTLRRELRTKQEELQQKQQSLEEARRSLNQRQDEAQAARAELARLRRERAELQGGSQTATARLDALQRAIEESEAGARSKDREASDLQARLTRAQDEAKRPQVERDREIQGLRERLARAEAETQAQRAGFEQLRREREQAGPEIELTQIQVVEPQLVALTRDIRVQATSSAGPGLSLLIAGKVKALGGLQSLAVNGREEVVDGDGVFKARVPLKGTEEERVRLVAVDRAGRKATIEMIVPGRVHLSGTAAGEGRRLPLPTPAFSLGTYHALVIGNNEYKGFKLLKTAVNDAEATATVLRDRYGFRVKLLRNATRLQILSELNDLRQRLTDKDNLLIYYAGHGELDQKNQRGYWLPVDAVPGNTANWISNIDLSDLLNLMAVKHLLVVADSCYAATLTRSSAGRLEPTMTQEELARAVQTLASKRARVVLTSGGVEPVLDNAGGQHSVFAEIFLEILSSNDGVLLGRDLFQHLQLRVHAMAQRWAVPQVPEYSPIKYAGHEGGDFFFLRTGT
jgi:TPR repeat protein